MVRDPEERVFTQGYNLKRKTVNQLYSYPNVAHVNNKSLKFRPAIMDNIAYRVICGKATLFLEAMRRFPDEEIFIVMDVDMIVIKSLKGLREEMMDYDLGAVWVNEGKIMGGFIAIRRCYMMKRFLKEWGKKMSWGRYTYNKDQPALAEVFNKYLGKVEFLSLPRQYLDHTENLNSYVWSAHKVKNFGSKKSRAIKYADYVNIMRGNING